MGDAVGFDEAKRDFDAGNYGQAAVGAGLSVLGVIPGAGDAATSVLKKGVNEWRDMYHGTKSGVFDKFRLSDKDIGIHATPDAEIANRYAGMDPESMIGPSEAVNGHIMPVKVRVGKSFDARGLIPDPVNWKDNERIIEGIYDSNDTLSPEIASMVEALKEGATIDQVLKSRGYDSMTYDHYPDPHAAPSEAVMLLSPDDIVP